ncbi:hypothetical protein HAPAU_40530 [Halalkalicoccus paucihalophilus]|uniref:Uncharacterized protein n=1 Tax=Halalkalicoccus paucihalophilus TaxID=1008153 RepID=A0A151A8Q0_9EURY|nr:hypothetical protein HAPAU_40530 [Halalkalicoccus paucihalophilus]
MIRNTGRQRRIGSSHPRRYCHFSTKSCVPMAQTPSDILPGLKAGASYKGRLLRGFRTVVRKRRLSGFPTRRAVSCGTVTSAPVLWRVIGVRFQRAPLSPRVDAVGDVRRRVDVCLILRNPTLRVRTTELGLRTTPTDVSARVARLRGVRRVDEPDRDACVKRLILDPPGKASEGPRVKASVHVLPVVESFPDVRQVFKDDYGVVEGFGVFDGTPRRLLNDVR